jgi:hypothetical protein
MSNGILSSQNPLNRNEVLKFYFYQKIRNGYTEVKTESQSVLKKEAKIQHESEELTTSGGIPLRMFERIPDAEEREGFLSAMRGGALVLPKGYAEVKNFFPFKQLKKILVIFPIAMPHSVTEKYQ